MKSSMTKSNLDYGKDLPSDRDFISRFNFSAKTSNLEMSLSFTSF